ncbi:MAG: hydrogenase maturation protease [Bacteroidales bacterium]|nr:hydrogenase maturation protease [Bacteroidales bacterium]
MKNLNHKKTMIFGIGNSARQDDGLGWAFLDEIEKTSKFKGELHYRYQLNIEDAETVSKAEQILFVDANSETLKDSCVFEECKLNGEITFTTHALDPGAILALCKDVYDKQPKAYVLRIRGFGWDLGEGLSTQGKQNLKDALKLMKGIT